MSTSTLWARIHTSKIHEIRSIFLILHIPTICEERSCAAAGGQDIAMTAGSAIKVGTRLIRSVPSAPEYCAVLLTYGPELLTGERPRRRFWNAVDDCRLAVG